MSNARLDDAQAGIKIAGRNINNLRYAHDTTLMTESEEELKSLLMRVKKESEKASLKLNVKKKKTKIMASGNATQGKKWKQLQVLFSQAQNSIRMVTATMKLEDTCFLEGRL